MHILCKKFTVVLEFVKLNLGSSEAQRGPRLTHVMNPRVLKLPLENRVKLLMLTKIKFLSLNKLNICTYDNIDNHTKGLWLVNGYIIYFRRKLEDTKLQIVCSLGMVFQYFFTVLSTWKREETLRRWECNEQWVNNKL